MDPPVRKKIRVQDKRPTVEEVYEKDLPILSNVEQVHISHYLLSLRFHFEKKVIQGTLILFPVKKEIGGETLEKIVLDACSLVTTSVSTCSLNLKDLSTTSPQDLYTCFNQLQEETETNLNFVQDKWCLTIHLPPVTFPTSIKIVYYTLPSSPSVQWRPSVGFVPKDTVPLCCFTPAAPVNNRGLFPCQEAPESLATWITFTILKDPYSALLSSDEPGIVIGTTDDDQWTISYFSCSEVLPMSTLALFVSQLSPTNIFEIVQPKQSFTLCDNSSHQKDNELYNDSDMRQEGGPQFDLSLIPVRIICQNDESDLNFSKLSSYVIRLLEASYSVLGPLPFRRLDIVLMPDCFPVVGLCNPSMVFLSVSVLRGDPPLIYSRLTHELAHFWFGLSIGSLDWTEEWLSEGFATFIEDIFYLKILEDMRETKVEKVIQDEEVEKAIQELKLKPCIRLVTLQNELDNTSSEQDLQLLQRNDNDRENPSMNRVVLNGLEPLKQFMQVHYLKGYFFLQHLCSLVGEGQFLKFLQAYVLKFQGTLLKSVHFLDFFKSYFCIPAKEDHFPTTTKLSCEQIDSISHDWLQSPSLPEPFKSANVRQPVLILSDKVQQLFPDSIQQLMNVNCLTVWFNCLTGNLSGGNNNDIFLNSSATEKLLFLELVIASNENVGEAKINHLMENLIQFDKENPEIQHRLCEVIVKSQCLSKIGTVEQFLLDHPAMGVYLYGELIISERKQFQKLARSLYKRRKDILDPQSVHVLKQMLF